MNRYAFIFFGIAFGFLLSRAGATTYDNYAGLFLFENLQLMWVIGAAALTGGIGLFVLRKLGMHAVFGGEAINIEPKPWRPTLIAGALMLGVGWGIAGTCPGTSMAMLGEGKLPALVAIAGILSGTYLYGVFESRNVRDVDDGGAAAVAAE